MCKSHCGGIAAEQAVCVGVEWAVKGDMFSAETRTQREQFGSC